jgi:hypothetical protein
MKRFVGSFAVVIAATFALVGAPHAAQAGTCSPADSATSGRLARVLTNAVAERKYDEAEAAYQQLAALDPSCLNSLIHSFGATAARKRGDIHNALLRYNLAGNTAGVAEINGAYGMVRINPSSTAPSPRNLSWEGVLVTTQESRGAVDRVKAAIAGPNRVVGYLPPGRYFVMSGQTRILSFEIKAGETVLLNYP